MDHNFIYSAFCAKSDSYGFKLANFGDKIPNMGFAESAAHPCRNQIRVNQEFKMLSGVQVGRFCNRSMKFTGLSNSKLY